MWIYNYNIQGFSLYVICFHFVNINATAIQSLTTRFLSLYNNEERVTVKSGISLQRLMPIFLFFYGKDVNVLIS